MPRHSRNEIKAGVFILLAFALLCAGIYIVGDLDTLLKPKKAYHFSFGKVEGLKAGDDVLYAGIKCGTVTNVRWQPCKEIARLLDRPEPKKNDGDESEKEKEARAQTRVLVTVEIDGDAPVKAHDEPKIVKGLTGNIYLDIVPFKRGPKIDVPLAGALATTAKTPLKAVSSPTFEDLAVKAGEFMTEAKTILNDVKVRLALLDPVIDSAGRAANNVDNITGTVKTLLNNNKQIISETVRNTRDASRNTRDVTGEIRGALVKEDGRRPLDDIVRNTRDTTQHARDILATAKKKVDEDKMLDKIDEAVTDARDAVKDARKTMASAREVIVDNRANIDGTIEELRQAAARLNLGMEDIRRNPWKLLTRNIEADAYTQNIYDSAMCFAEGARALSHASANMEALLSRPETDPADIKRNAEKINQLVTEMAKLEKLLYEAMKKRP